MANEKVILKLKYGGVYRRLQLHQRPLTLSEVTVSTDMELEVATHPTVDGLIFRLNVERAQHPSSCQQNKQKENLLLPPETRRELSLNSTSPAPHLLEYHDWSSSKSTL